MENRILIASPTSSAKHYCFPEWLGNILLTLHGNFKVVLFDNTLDNGESAEYQNAYYKKKYGNGGQFECVKSNTEGLESSVIARVCRGHNDAREYAIKNGYSHLWHVESDIFPEPNFLQELILHDKPVIGAIYDRDHGRFRKLMVQQRVYSGPRKVDHLNFDPQDCAFWIDGTVKEVGHIGLGCLLIKTDVLKKIPFRFVPGQHIFPDSYFAEDLFKAGIKIFADTACVCTHKNQNWQTEIFTKNNKA